MEEKSPDIVTEKALVGHSPMAAFELAIAHNVDIDKLEKMLALQERFDAIQAKKAYVQAMANFKSVPLKITKNKHVKFSLKTGGSTDYKHATLGHVTDIINSELAKHSLSAGWKTTQDQSGITVTCTITHNLGHSESTALTAGKEQSGTKNDIQAIGSTITYLQRYTLLALTGLATHDQDDDGKKADIVFINGKQVSTIYDMIADTETNESKFLEWLKVESVETIPANLFNKAMAALKAKVKK